MNEDWRNWEAFNVTTDDQKHGVWISVKRPGKFPCPNFVNDYVVAALYVYGNTETYELK
jgi:hypothetical protein